MNVLNTIRLKLTEFVAQSAPATPASGIGSLWFDSTNKRFKQIDDAGVVSDLVETPGTSIATAQTNVSNSAATLISSRSGRSRVVIVNRQTAAIFVGPATVSTSNGFQIDPGGSLVLYTSALIQAITASASAAAEKVHTTEEYV